MKVCELRPFKEEHLEDAAHLFSKNYRIARTHVPIMPKRYEDPNTILPFLKNLAPKVPGIVAIANSKISGYLMGHVLREWRGRRSVFVPFWAHSVADINRKNILQEMYAYLSPEWIINGCFTHLISVLAHDKVMINTLFWMGFGMAVIDTIRDFSKIHGHIADVNIRRANLDDMDVVMSLDHALQRYLAGPPIFMAMTEKRSREYHEKWLSDPSMAFWLASHKGKVVSYIKICPFNEDFVITDDKTAWIQGAYTQEHLRGTGIGTALLKRCLDWAQSQGYERCAVDFEGENVLASAFWLSHFTPMCFSLTRQIDKQIAWAHKDRKDEYFW